MYGVKYIADYRTKIAELFNRGVEQTSNKMNLAAMLQLLESKLRRAGMKNTLTAATTTSNTRSTALQRIRLDSKYAAFINAMLSEDGTIKWKSAIARMQEHDGGNFIVVPAGREKDSFIGKLQNKFNNMKTSNTRSKKDQRKG
eukprot:IDg6730t1